MRYIDPGRYDDRIAEIAEALFERFIGRSLVRKRYIESCRLVNGMGWLQHVPVLRVESVEATVSSPSVVPWAMSADVEPVHVNRDAGVFVLPRSMFGDSYDRAIVTYIAGYDPIPSDAIECVEEIATLVRDGQMDEWSSPSALSDAAQSIIAKYRR